MPVSDILERPQPPLPWGIQRPTNQQLADMALAEDQARRRALAQGDVAGAVAALGYTIERDAICAQLT
jgi:hypothetical protein